MSYSIKVKLSAYGYDELDELDHSFCTTIHKSQGSEFPVVVIPIVMGTTNVT